MPCATLSWGRREARDFAASAQRNGNPYYALPLVENNGQWYVYQPQSAYHLRENRFLFFPDDGNGAAAGGASNPRQAEE